MQTICAAAVVLAGSSLIVNTHPASATLLRAFGNLDGDAALKVNIVRGFVDIYINGTKVGRYGKKDALASNTGIASVDLNTYIKPGNNTLRAVWSETRSPIGTVHVSYADAPGKYRKLSEITFGVSTKNSGDKTVQFVIPVAADSSEKASTLPPGKDSAPLTNRDAAPTGSADKGQVAAGSHANQTLLTASIARGDITVFVNNKKVGSYTQGNVPIDISNYTRSGPNRLRLAWQDGSASPIGNVRISYAASASNFRKIAEFDMSVFTRKKGDNTVTFNLP